MSALDPRNTVDKPGTSPNKGLNTRVFLLWVGAALVAILVVLFFVAWKPGPKGITPKEPSGAHPTSSSAPQ